MKDFLCIVLGADENAYAVARQVHEKYGERALLLCSKRLRASSHSNILDIECYCGFDTKEVFLPTMKRILTEKSKEYAKIIVIPCVDYYTALVVDNYDSFDGLIANKFYTPELMRMMFNKDKFYELCEKYGMVYPKTYVITPENRMDPPFIGKMDFPFIMKPENSNATEYLHVDFEDKRKVYYLYSYEEYFKVIKAMNGTDYKGNLVVQEFIKGNDAAMKVMNCYVDSDHNVLAAVSGQPVLEEYVPTMLGNNSAIISRNIPVIEERAERFLKQIGYVGFANIDMKYDKVRDEYYILEINPRLARTSFFIHNAGVNMPGLLIDDVVYGKKPDTCVHSQRTGLWTAVPRCVLMKYIKDKEIRDEVKKLYPRSERSNWYKKDMNLKRRYVISRIFYGYIRTYKKYFFEKPE